MITYNGKQITEEEFATISNEIEDLDIEIKASKKKEPMEKLNYRFNKRVKSECEALSEMLTGHNQSDVARAAIALGISQIKKALKDGERQANGIVHIGKLRHDLLK